MTHTGPLHGRVVLLTGADGSAAELIGSLVARGARVAVAGGGPPRPLAVPGSPVLALPCDTRDPTETAGVIDTVVDRLGRLDHLVNLVAAPPRPGRLTDLDPPALRGALDRHLVMPLAWTQRACRRRLSEHGGSVVNAVTDAVRNACQAAATAALTELTEWLSAELGPRVAVHTVVPSPSTGAAAYRTALADAVPRLLVRPGGEAAHRVHGPVLVLTAPPERPSHAA